MDIVEYYTEMSKVEALKDKEIREFSEELNSKYEKVRNLKLNTSICKKILHPFRTISTSLNYKELSIIKRDFDAYISSDVLMYDNGDFGELVEDLEGAAKYYKPKIIREYVKSQKMVLQRIK